MKGVTIISPGFEAAGEEAVARFRRFAGAEADVLRCSDNEAHRVKLQAFADAARHGWRWWFDADWWLLRPCETKIRATLGPWVAGTPIPVDQARKEGLEYGFDPRCRITTGFVAFDPTLPHWDQALTLALELQAHRGQQRDELFLNAALHHFQVPARLLDSGWNWCFQAVDLYGYVPPQIHAIHAAGMAAQHKEAALRQAAEAHADRVNTWSLEVAELAWLGAFAGALRDAGLPRVVEFGPGLSTFKLLEAGCAVTSCETEPRAYSIAKATFPSAVNLRLMPYQEGLGGLEAACDWAFIDGPPGHLQTDGKSRWHALDWCRAHCRLMVLHDSKRPAEQKSIAALAELGWTALPVETPRGLCVLTLGEEATALARSCLAKAATFPGC